MWGVILDYLIEFKLFMNVKWLLISLSLIVQVRASSSLKRATTRLATKVKMMTVDL